jgi:hypothetical protein
MDTRHLGRYTAQLDGDFVVFLIGMRLNRPWKVHQWWPVFAGMQRMLRDLHRHPAKGLLGAYSGLLNGGPAVVSTGAASSTWTASPATRPASTCPPGGGSTGR